MTDHSNRQYENAKQRMSSSISFVWRHYGEDGEGLLVDDLRDDFASVSKDADTLSAQWSLLSFEQQQKVRDMIEQPAVGVRLPSGKEWKDYDLMVLDLLEKSETVQFAEEQE